MILSRSQDAKSGRFRGSPFDEIEAIQAIVVLQSGTTPRRDEILQRLTNLLVRLQVAMYLLLIPRALFSSVTVPGCRLVSDLPPNVLSVGGKWPKRRKACSSMQKKSWSERGQ